MPELPSTAKVLNEMSTHLKQAVWLVCVLSVSASAAGAEPVTTVTLCVPAGQPLKDVPVTFGQVFRKGDIRQGVLANAARQRSKPMSNERMTTAPSASRSSRCGCRNWTAKRG